MRYALMLILACLVIASPVLAAVFPCSNESSGNFSTGNYSATYGAVMVKTIPGGAIVTLDPGTNYSYTGTSPFAIGGFPGIHSFTISLPGYKDYSGQYASCTKRFTYVEVTLSSDVNYTYRRMGTFGVLMTDTPVQGTTTLPVRAMTTVTPRIPITSGTSAPQDMLGSLSVTTIPAGAFIFIDGVQRGVSPATIPGLSAGTHTVLLKLDGYLDLSTPATLAAGTTQDYATAMVKNAEAGNTQLAIENKTASTRQNIAPGFEFAAALIAMGAINVIIKRSKE